MSWISMIMILPTKAERVRRFVKGLIIPIRLGVSQVATIPEGGGCC